MGPGFLDARVELRPLFLSLTAGESACSDNGSTLCCSDVLPKWEKTRRRAAPGELIVLYIEFCGTDWNPESVLKQEFGFSFSFFSIFKFDFVTYSRFPHGRTERCPGG